jgi:cell division protein FtsB
METYLFKIIACSAVLIGFYYLFLAKEKSFQFNRFYLIFALLFSYIIPFVSWELPAKEVAKTGIIFQETAGEIMMIPAKPVETELNWEMIVLVIYGLITLFLLMKSLFSIIKILKLKGNFIKVNNLKTKVLEENISPFSFLGTLYIGKNYFKNNSIDERIFLHEKNHIEQKHSRDLILIELLKIVSWFNPALYFYKKAIITNHEFLADENVLSQNFEVQSYQKLILEEISTNQNLQFTNQFNFNNTKKRFIMMTKTKSRFTQVKQIFTLPILVALSFVFVQKTYAKTISTENNIVELPTKTLESSPKIQNESTLLKDEKVVVKNDTIRKPTKKVESKIPPPPSPNAPETRQDPPNAPSDKNMKNGKTGSYITPPQLVEKKCRCSTRISWRNECF